MPRQLLIGSGRSEQNAAVGGSTLLHSPQRRLLVPRQGSRTTRATHRGGEAAQIRPPVNPLSPEKLASRGWAASRRCRGQPTGRGREGTPWASTLAHGRARTCGPI
eukprot:4569475-Prymnesium_polylepis.1